jgi:hypothetical protein
MGRDAALDAMGLKPAAASAETRRSAPAPAPLAQLKRNVTPRDHWLPELSGPNARLRVNVERAAVANCLTPAPGCERPETPREASLAGVVVKTRRLADEPTTALDGRVRRGNFVEKTPAVFVE